MSFIIPKDQKWINQVFVGNQEEVNAFIKKCSESEEIGNPKIHSFVNADCILVIYDKDVNYEPTKTT